MVEATCECGAVHVKLDTAPETVGDCNCSICRRYGALWAYYHTAAVQVTGNTTIYVRRNRHIEFHHCAVCRCLTHWSSFDKSHTRMGVNARLLPPEVLQRAKIVPLAGASM